MENKLEKLIIRLFEIEVVKFGNYKLKSGVFSPIYFDLRVIVSHPDLMKLLTDLLVELIQKSVNEKFQHVCGVPYTALPMATLVSVNVDKSMLIRRKEVKDHGTRKMIEGRFNKGDNCIIIEDVVSSGSSILETVQELKSEGLKVSNAIVVLDREQGGVKNLQDQGLHVNILMSLDKILETLVKHKKISEETFKEVKEYVSRVRLTNFKTNPGTNNDVIKNRLSLTFGERSKLAKCKIARKLFDIIEMKKSLLCVAADVDNSNELIKLASEIGPHICIFKTHFDTIEDFNKNSYFELMKIAKNNNFLIMEDRKFSDIGNTVNLQYKLIKNWSDIVTTHSISGESIIDALKSCVKTDEEKGCFIVAELSCQGNLIGKEYSTATVKMAEKHSDYVIGLVCQSPELIKVPHLIQLTPGVKIEEGSDGLGQNYNSPEYVVLEKGADVAVVGRGIIKSQNPEKAAILYKEKLWDASLKRISMSG
ncbi:conserved hypothetical protein [Pediculus humanus corporis]|uniref:Uridine 5'-monophosphate synthase n=1 Tax=Pediculus humanus subsp. corporis TaxID=121224 RepID=E0VTC0_PEDHC|nr:uncharacterized protein Phum_PHUM430300 [Pediculus humanus corporis]EEB16626.1 conserved hypothetical protein [Pediculus humanus corporis]